MLNTTSKINLLTWITSYNSLRRRRILFLSDTCFIYVWNQYATITATVTNAENQLTFMEKRFVTTFRRISKYLNTIVSIMFAFVPSWIFSQVYLIIRTDDVYAVSPSSTKNEKINKSVRKCFDPVFATLKNSARGVRGRGMMTVKFG